MSATVMAEGDTYDTGKNSAASTSKNHGHNATDTGKDALREDTADIVTCENVVTTGSLVSTIIMTTCT